MKNNDILDILAQWVSDFINERSIRREKIIKEFKSEELICAYYLGEESGLREAGYMLMNVLNEIRKDMSGSQNNNDGDIQ
jgi:hypothetical protein